MPPLSQDAPLLSSYRRFSRPGEIERAKALLNVGADVLVVDSSQGDSVFQIDLVKQLKSAFPDTQVGVVQAGRGHLTRQVLLTASKHCLVLLRS